MSRRHLFPLVVLLAAAAVAGLLALARAVDLGRPAAASTGEQPAIAFRLARLDKEERALRQQLADLRRASAAGTQTVYERGAAAPSSTQVADDDHGEDDHGEDDHGEDDHGEDEHGEDDHESEERDD